MQGRNSQGSGIVSALRVTIARARPNLSFSYVKGRAEFPRILMNPPFRDVRKHVAAALTLLGRGGHVEAATLVALVPVTFDHPEAEHLETLPPDTFSTARVHTKIVRVRRV